MEKKEILETFEPLSDEQARLILGGVADPVCDIYDTCTSTSGCTESRDCQDGTWLLNCEDEEKCWTCRATIAH
ncbi:MAG: hypothetical protein IPN20_20040 [Haliscomenobacter sp.]|jgi:hypothetical protein|nr:hypothetical protein [Haliscomenobacter sp.]MBK8656145.1 hypothetical protein [Haliscomenobacter sp.]